MTELDNFDLWDDSPPDFNEQRLDIEWLGLNAIREMLGVALKGKTTPTYEQALDFGRLLAPKIYRTDFSLIGQGNESQLVREYRQSAEAQSRIDQREVKPIELVDVDIKKFTTLFENAGENRDQIKRRLNTLHSVRLQLQPKSYTENQLILRDLFKAHRNIPVPPIEGDTYRDFRLTKDRGPG